MPVAETGVTPVEDRAKQAKVPAMANEVRANNLLLIL
jgi:hypothetical protein